jgi:hypothetical protein
VTEVSQAGAPDTRYWHSSERRAITVTHCPQSGKVLSSSGEWAAVTDEEYARLRLSAGLREFIAFPSAQPN